MMLGWSRTDKISISLSISSFKSLSYFSILMILIATFFPEILLIAS